MNEDFPSLSISSSVTMGYLPRLFLTDGQVYACVIGQGHHVGYNCYIRMMHWDGYTVFQQVFNIILYRVRMSPHYFNFRTNSFSNLFSPQTLEEARAD